MRILSKLAAMFGGVLAAVTIANPAAAQDVLHVIQVGNLYTVDTGSLTATFRGATGFSQVGGLAFDSRGVLYGVDTLGDQLIIIDKNSGASSVVGSLHAPVSLSTGLGNDPTTELLYGATQQGLGFSSFLAIFCKVSGVSQPVVDTGADGIVGLDFDTNGQLWGIDGRKEELVRIDKTTGVTTTIGAGGLASFPFAGGLDIGPSGTYWGIDTSGGRTTLFSIDSTTGVPTIVGQITGMGTGVVTAIASESPCTLDVTVIFPLAGALNTIVTDCATPNGQVIMAGNKKTGSSPTSVCGLNWGIKNAREFSATADGAGTATTSVFVPAKAAGFSVPIRALDVTTCTLSALKMIQF